MHVVVAEDHQLFDRTGPAPAVEFNLKGGHEALDGRVALERGVGVRQFHCGQDVFRVVVQGVVECEFELGFCGQRVGAVGDRVSHHGLLERVATVRREVEVDERHGNVVCTAHRRLAVENHFYVFVHRVRALRSEIVAERLVDHVYDVKLTLATFFPVRLITPLNTVKLEY